MILAGKQSGQVKLTEAAMKSVITSLRDLGLATYEAQSYIGLIQNPDVSATQLCIETGIPDSKIYFALEELQKKGMIVSSEGVPRRYRALHPKQALGKLKSIVTEEYETRLEKLNQLLPSLEPLYTRSERGDVELAYVVKGFENVLDRMIETMKSAKREVVIFIPNGAIYSRLELQLVKLRQSGVSVRLAVPPGMHKQIGHGRFSEIREMSPDCEDCWITVVDNKTVISSSQWMTERCHAIMTQDPVLVAMSREYFESPRCCVPA
jgi:sugar-specific transcriptional regulator TrmB